MQTNYQSLLPNWEVMVASKGKKVVVAFEQPVNQSVVKTQRVDPCDQQLADIIQLETLGIDPCHL